MSDPRLHSWDNPLGRMPGVPVPRVTWLAALTAPGCMVPTAGTLGKRGTGAVARVVDAPTVHAAVRAVTGTRPTPALVEVLTRWAVGQHGAQLDVTPVTVALLAARCDLADDQVAHVVGRCAPDLPPLSDDMLVALVHALGTSRRDDLVALLTDAGGDHGTWRRLHETGHLLASSLPTRVPAAPDVARWAARVARRATPTEVGDPRWARRLEASTTPAGRHLTALRTHAAVAQVEQDWDVELPASSGRPTGWTVQVFTVHGPDGERLAAGTVADGWECLRVVGLQAPGGDRVPDAVADDVVGHVTALHVPVALGQAVDPFT